VIEDRGVSVRLILGNAYGRVAPASMFSETFYADVKLEPGSRLPMPDDHEDRGIYIVEGSVSVAGQTFEASQMMVFRPGDRITVAAGGQGARLMILGGATLSGPRYIWWNFVASSRSASKRPRPNGARRTGATGRFDLPADDRDEYIPLPD
jgi:redox-sensitive bicupin YhaK (pirin superfamily)